MPLEAVLALDERDAGCDAARAALERYVESADPAGRFPAIAVHLAACRACRTDHDGLLALITHDRRTPR